MSIGTKRAIRFAQRVRDIQTSPTLVVMNRAKEMAARGIDVIDLGPGEPDFNTPELVKQAGNRAIELDLTRYTNTLGTPEIRREIADSYNRRWGSSIGIENVIVGSGGKQELFNTMLALVGEGDEVIVPVPYWVSFPDQVTFAGGIPVFAPTRRENHYRPTLEDVEPYVTPATRGVILNSPCNPSGAVIEEEQLRRIIALCRSRDLFLLFDETYEFFVYDGVRHVSAVRWFHEFPETVIVVNSLSKTFAMTGWRIGYAVAHPEIIDALGRIQSHSTSNASSISQHAAVEALRGGSDAVRKMYDAMWNGARGWCRRSTTFRASSAFLPTGLSTSFRG